jgi:pimeloyl-ACP methyl ester carboxylesterase/heme-degrading monooxygenase HmoA
MRATIPSEGVNATFVQTWAMDSKANQDGWLATMGRRVSALTAKQGFVSISLHRSDDGKRIAVYAQWRTDSDLAAAAESPDAKAGRAELDKWGTADGAVYRVAAVHGPSRDAAVAPGLPSESLSDEVAKRWAALGFTTRNVSVNGVVLHVAEAGRGAPIILLHGYPQSGEIWRLIAADLATNHHVVIPDLRGMGLSEAAADGYNLSNVAEDIHELTRSLGYTRVKIVGHDWGASVAAVYALRYRDEVTKLGFIESALPGCGFEDLWTFAKPNDGFTFIPFLLMGGADVDDDATANLLRGREELFLHHLWRKFTGDQKAAPFENWHPYIAALARPGVLRSSASYYRAAYRSADEVRNLIGRQLEIPVLSIAGEKGMGALQQSFVRAFSNNLSASVVIPGAGHFIAEERPTEAASALKGFLND